MNIKNIVTLSAIGSVLLLFVSAGLIISGIYLAPAALTAMYLPEAISEVE